LRQKQLKKQKYLISKNIFNQMKNLYFWPKTVQ